MGNDQLIYISQKTLEKYPLSKYREGNYYPIQDIQDTPPSQDKKDPNDDKTASNDLGATEIYWTTDKAAKLASKQAVSPKKPRHFNIQIHGLRKRRPMYYFHCKINGCMHTFYTLKGWNIHHCTS